LDGINPRQPNWGQTPIEKLLPALPQGTQRNAEDGAPRPVGPPRAGNFLWGRPLGKHRVTSRASVPTRKSGRVGGRISSSVVLCVLCVCGESCSKLFKAVQSCPVIHAKRSHRADPFNPPNPRPKLLMPTSRATTRGPTDRLQPLIESQTSRPTPESGGAECVGISAAAGGLTIDGFDNDVTTRARGEVRCERLRSAAYDAISSVRPNDHSRASAFGDDHHSTVDRHEQ
jgi:hypothetical protein